MKQLQTQEKMVESLLNLRNELARRGYSEIAFKINSCLFKSRKYHTVVTKTCAKQKSLNDSSAILGDGRKSRLKTYLKR